MKKASLILLSAMFIFMISCIKESSPDFQQGTDDIISMEDLIIDESFDFKTTREIQIHIRTLDNNDQALPHILLKLSTGDLNLSSGTIENEKVVFRGLSNAEGIVSGVIALPASVEHLYLNSDYIGLPANIQLDARPLNVYFNYGGKNSGNQKSASEIFGTTQVNYQTMGTWNSQGVPNYLEAAGDVIDASFLSDINASLPEGQPLPNSHPMYFNSNLDFGLRLQDSADVWITFVHEGAGWKNTLGYYYYNENNPPQSVSDITTGTIVFPNVSFAGSGGGLYAGDKVYLGAFPAGTVIHWFLIAQGWNSSNATVGNGVYTHYSESQFNIENSSSLQQHTVLLYDAQRELFLLGFEDINRELPNCDQDFNDAVFYATANPITAVVTNNLPPIDTPTDTDGDGVTDSFDEYPNDSTRAYNSYSPAEGVFGTLAYEDLWPETGDYDFNDIVVDYNFQTVLNASNQVVDLIPRYVLKASGASYHNSFGIELPISPSIVESVSGGSFTDNFINRSSNGTEANQTNAVVIAFEDAYNVLPYSGGTLGINTTQGTAPVIADTIVQTIHFATPLSSSSLGSAPYNPFIIVGLDRGVEVHLINNPPTDLADPLLFGTGDDNSVPGNDLYFRTQNLLPWGINLPESFDYPAEKNPVNQAYLKFNDWAQSGGVLYPDWYEDQQGYRNSTLIY